MTDERKHGIIRKIFRIREGHVMMWAVFTGLLIAGIGVFVFLKPRLIWDLTEKRKSYRADEPSGFYLKATKLSGALLALAGIFVALLPFFLK